MAATLFRIHTPVDLPTFTLRSTLDGVEFVLRFDYSEKEDRWYFSIFDANEVPIYRGVKVCPNKMLLDRCKVDGRPKGFLAVYGPDVAPGFSDLGRTHALFYLTDVP